MVHVVPRLMFLCLVVSLLALVIPSAFNPEPVKAIPAPANDDFADAVVVTTNPFTHSVVPRPVGTGNGTLPDINDADVEVGEPTGFLGGACAAVNSTLWYRITPGSGRVLVSTLGSDAAADTVVRVFTGATVGALTLIPAGTCRFGQSCDDDGGAAFGLGTRSYMVFCATAGTTYNIQVGDFGAATPPTVGQRWSVYIRVGG